jgi:hypothetical protein
LRGSILGDAPLFAADGFAVFDVFLAVFALALAVAAGRRDTAIFAVFLDFVLAADLEAVFRAEELFFLIAFFAISQLSLNEACLFSYFEKRTFTLSQSCKP